LFPGMYDELKLRIRTEEESLTAPSQSRLF